MKKINLFVIECSSEEEEYVYYFNGDGDREEFEKDGKWYNKIWNSRLLEV